MKLKTLRGMNDILPPAIYKWQRVEAIFREISARYGYSEIRTPILEMTDLFQRGVGQDTDVVEKEMYSFEDRNGDNISLRPEGTAPVVRSCIEHNYVRNNPTAKLYYIGPMFRHERPQKGRYRQFYSYGAELMGVDAPEADVEVMAMVHTLLFALGLANVELRLSSVGCRQCRPTYKEMLCKKLQTIQDQLPQDFHSRIQSNPQRIFDHKDEKVQKLTANLPLLLDHLCQSCVQHMQAVEEGLQNLSISFVRDPKIVRGLDYYQRTAFEFISSDLGAQATVCGGGRYDGLFETLGGQPTPAVGFGLGIERLIMILEARGFEVSPHNQVSVIAVDKSSKDYCQKIAQELRQQGLVVDVDLQGKTFKSQLKRADKLNSQYCLILGEDELVAKKIILKDMKHHSQKDLPLENYQEELLSKFK